MALRFNNLDDAIDTAINALEWIRENATIPERDDWEEYKKEELARDAALEEKEKLITIEDVRAVLADISRNGHTADVKELLKKYGANKLSEVKSEDLTALLKDAEVFK